TPPGTSAAAGPWYCTAVFLARNVIPFSRSRSPESIARVATCACSPKAPEVQSIASTSVVLPWSTWATIATLRRSERRWVAAAIWGGRLRAGGGRGGWGGSVGAGGVVTSGR